MSCDPSKHGLHTLCLFVGVKGIRRCTAILDRPPADASSLGVVSDAPLKQLIQRGHVRYRGPSGPRNLTAINGTDSILVPFFSTSLAHGYCADANVTDLLAMIVYFGADVS